MKRRCVRRMTCHHSWHVLSILQRPQPPDVAAAPIDGEAEMLARVRQVFHTETLQLLVDPVELLDPARAVDIVDVHEVDMVLVLEYKQELEMKLYMEVVLHQHWDTGLMLNHCRKVVDSYFVLCFPYFSL